MASEAEVSITSATQVDTVRTRSPLACSTAASTCGRRAAALSTHTPGPGTVVFIARVAACVSCVDDSKLLIRVSE